MLWIALHLPHLPLQALCRSSPEPDAARGPGLGPAMAGPGSPRAIVQDRQLIAINRAAMALGVRIGHSSATAQSLAPQLQLQSRDVDREHAFVQALALALGVFTPQLCLQASGVLMEVQASLRLFGGLRRLLRRIESVARQCGARARLATARTASAAWLLAANDRVPRASGRVDPDDDRDDNREGDRTDPRPRDARRLDALPVDALQALLALRPQAVEALQTLGLRQLRELRALPRAGLQRRFGAELLRSLDRAYGDAPDPRPWMPVPERFATRCELMQRADDAGSLTSAVQLLLPALGGWLQLRWEAATALTLRMRHEHRRVPTPDTCLRLALSTPSRDMAQLALLWRERLARHALAAPVYEIALELDAAVPHGGRPGELLPIAGGQAADHAALLDRLTARLGPEHVLRCEPLADHRPERAQRSVAASASSAPAKGGSSAPATPPHTFASTAGDDAATLACARPTWLLDPPRPLACDALGRPQHGGPLRLCSRAERIEAGWFDGTLVCRDYQVAEGSDHRLRWIYRERTLDGSARWFLHGWFG